MKYLSGSIVVLSGSLIIGLSGDRIPNSMFFTLVSLGLVVFGLVVIVIAMKEKN